MITHSCCQVKRKTVDHKKKFISLKMIFLIPITDVTIEFPNDYPVGCLLGCVDVVDCLSQEDYSQKVNQMDTFDCYFSFCFKL